MEYLYHYTSLETLALILANKTICFNNLLNVDDIEEAESADMGLFGRFVYVSCWTDESKESIPLWNLYTPDMHGVRIKLPIFPFKKHKYKRGELFFTEEIETYIDCYKIYSDNKVSIAPNNPILKKVEYTDEVNKLYPKIKTESFVGATEKFLNAKSMKELCGERIEISYSMEEIGKYKREDWKFQSEWRYIITFTPMGLQELGPPTFEKQQEYLRRLENREIVPPYQRIFLDVDEAAFEDMEVVFGPRMNDAEKIMAISLLNRYVPNCKYKNSNLKIK